MLSSKFPLVSVIIPFFNGGNWLAEAIESVIGQSYTHWEIILIDDGSENLTTDIAKSFAYKLPQKIVYTHHPGHINKGVTISRNAGIRLSKGTFIAFLDADDCWLKEKLIHQLTIFNQHPVVQMVCEASCFWYSWNNTKEKDVIVNIGVKPDSVYNAPELLKCLYPLGKGAPPCPTGIMIKREALHRSGGFEELFSGVYQLYEDQAFLCKIYLKEAVYVSGTANNLYRKRPGSLTSLANDEIHYNKVRMFFLNWLEEYLTQHHLHTNVVLQLITAARLGLTS